MLFDVGEQISVTEFMRLCEDAGDGAQLELLDGILYFGDIPFYEFVKEYLKLRGEEPRPRITPHIDI